MKPITKPSPVYGSGVRYFGPGPGILLLSGASALALGCARRVLDDDLPTDSRATVIVVASPTSGRGITSSSNVTVFHAPPARHDRAATFTISAVGERIPGAMTFGLTREGAGRPEVGRYAIRFAGSGDSSFFAFVAYVPVPPGDTAYSYGSLQGVLDITRSSPNVVSGRFEFTAAEYSARWQPYGVRGSGTPAKLDSAAPRVTVRGTFSATPMGEGATSRRVASVDDTTSVMLWYAQTLVRRTPSNKKIIFAYAPRPIPDTMSARRVRELRRLGLNVVASAGPPGLDTLLVQFGPFGVDSVTSRGTFYVMGVTQTECNRDHSGSQTHHLIYARCDRRTCTRVWMAEPLPGTAC